MQRRRQYESRRIDRIPINIVFNLKPINKQKRIALKSTARESEVAEESDEDMVMFVREFTKFLKGKESDNGFNGANAKKDESNCFAGVASFQEAERYSSSDESQDESEEESTNIKVQKSNSSLLTIVKSLEDERDDAIKISEELKETNSKQEKEIADCMEMMKLTKEEIEQKEKSLEILRMREEEV
ncbi:hypothetical protein ACOSP7_004701 [Xanthoceras sorbifolium]